MLKSARTFGIVQMKQTKRVSCNYHIEYINISNNNNKYQIITKNIVIYRDNKKYIYIMHYI